MTGETFLKDVHVVVKQLMDWPPAWSMIEKVLHHDHPWTQPFCDKILGGAPWWQAIPIVRKSFITLRSTMAELERDLPPVAESTTKWLEELRLGGNSGTQKLLKSFRTSDKADTKNRTVHPRPFIRLMQKVHAKAIGHIFGKACKDIEPAFAKIFGKDMNNMTVLHHAASLGDAAAAKAILNSVPKIQREEFAEAQDSYGYTALDWARLGDFEDLVKVLSGKKAKAGGQDAEADKFDARSLFPKAAGSEAEISERCIWDGSSSGGCVAAADAGGWQPPAEGSLPTDWLPPADRPCSVDSIDVSSFSLEPFLQHYVLRPRPLLIRGVASATADRAKNYTRSRLLELAGEVKIEAEKYPESAQYDGSIPLAKTLREYVEYLDDRSQEDADEKKKLHFVFESLQPEAHELNFTRALPDILVNDGVEHKGTRFFLGGSLMGTPPRGDLPSINSLVFGRQLWFLQPPGQEVLVKEPVYDYLVRTGGAPGALRCAQGPGDALFVPRGWTHSSICAGDCVGATHYFSHKQYDLQDLDWYA